MLFVRGAGSPAACAILSVLTKNVFFAPMFRIHLKNARIFNKEPMRMVDISERFNTFTQEYRSGISTWGTHAYEHCTARPR